EVSYRAGSFSFGGNGGGASTAPTANTFQRLRMELYAWNSPVGIAAGSGRLLCFINDVQVFSSNLTTFITTPCFITCGAAGQSGGGVALVGAWTAMWNRGV